MKKMELHWQILIALILAIIYGIIFPTRYQITPDALEKLTQRRLPQEVVQPLQTLTDKEFTTQAAFLHALEDTLPPAQLKAHQQAILKVAYYNPAVSAIAWMGDLFIRALKMLIIPLILSSLVSGVTNIGGGDSLGRLGLKTMGYYVMTSTFAIVTGLVFVNLLKPGVGADLSLSREVEGLAESAQSLGQTLIEIIPTNIFQALMNGNMLSIIFFAILLGFFINKIDDRPRKTLAGFFNAFFDVMMKITLFVIRFTPLGILGIVAKVVADQDDLIGLASRMGLYMGTVLMALAFHAFISLPLILRLVGRINPLKQMQAMSTPLLTAFSTSSSGATLPLTMTAVEDKVGASNKVTSFTLPLGATINMDGTALYELVAAMFIAQAYGVDMTIGNQLIMVITALLASIGAAAIPMAGLVMITVVLTAVGLPLEGVGLILAVDRILDMFRTATNVWSDSCGAAVIAHSEGEALNVQQKMPPTE